MHQVNRHRLTSDYTVNTLSDGGEAMEPVGLRQASTGRSCPCGARIAADNSDRLCTACRRTAGQDVFGPPPLPDGFWEHPALSEAFTDQDMGALIGAYRHHPQHPHRITQDRMAGWLGISQAQLSRYENRENPIDRMEKLRHFAEVLGVPSERLWFDRTGPPRPRDPEGSVAQDVFTPSWDALSTARSVEEVTRSDLTLSRRAALTAGAAVAVGPALVEPMQHWLTPLQPLAKWSSGGAISPDELAATRTVVDGLRGWTGGGGIARKAVLGQLNELAERLCRAPDSPTTQQTFLLGADLAKMAAGMSWDAGLHDSAQRYYVLAVRMAKASRDEPFGALCLASMARQMFDLSRPEDGLELVQLGQYGTRRSATPTLRALLHTREAWAYALMGRVNEFHRAVGHAQECFAARDKVNEPHWLASFDEAEMEGVIGARLRDLAKHDPTQVFLAERHIRRALALRDPSRVRNRVFDIIGLARTRLATGEPEAACELIQQVLPMVVRLRSGRVRRRLQDFVTESAHYRQLNAVREVQDAIRVIRTA
jgi:transcriptional regulator with XRE-family HTH domain